MKVQADKKQKNNNAVSHSAAQQEMLQLKSADDKRPEAIQMQKMQQKANESIKNNPQAGSTIQLKAARAKGSTHLVILNHHSLMHGGKGEFITNRTPLDVDPNNRIISRRGPNQELVGDYDHRGAHMYRWYKVDDLRYINISGQNKYIREHTFRFTDAREHNHYRAHDLRGSRMPDTKRSRKSHIAVRFDVWYNSDRDIDRTGHMVMEDHSAAHRGEHPMHEYTWGANKAIEPVHSDHLVPFEMEGDAAGSHADHESASVPDGPTSKHKELLIKQESRHAKTASMRGQERYTDDERQRYFLKRTETRKHAVKRFNRKKSVEILVSMAEYRQLMRWFHGRKVGGFYCFYREARTVHGYQKATRCLSFLEDVAIMRNQRGLRPGHAADVLQQFAVLNRITEAHKGEGPV